jgi:pyruvate formate-lyase/glycerol dehydratase family glycyl radical enzyme
MEAMTKILTPQEERIEIGIAQTIAKRKSERENIRISNLNRILKDFRQKPPRIAVERARLMTESFKETESLPIVLRWAKALENILTKIEVYIGENDLLVGRCGPIGRYGILYPELRAAWYEKGLESLATRKEGAFICTEEDSLIIKNEIIPYWKGKTLFEATYNLLPDDTKRLLYKKDDPYTSSYIVLETSTERTSLQWVLDYEKVLNKGLNNIKREAQQRVSSLNPYDSENNFEKLPFLHAVIIVCESMVKFSERHAKLARSMASMMENSRRKRELLEIANICDWVPGNPARNFREAIQSQWFAQIGSRFETYHGGNIGNGRIDQYLYPYYKKDINDGLITDENALELLEHLWLNIAQCLAFRQSGNISHRQGYPHFEQTTIGGQTPSGQDATNELSYLILQSKKEFPLDYPDLSVRIHARTPDQFLWSVCELIKEGTGFPKLFNDEEIIPHLLAKGAHIREARDYCGSGCTEVRMLNKDTYMTGNSLVNIAAALEMALNDGKLRIEGKHIEERLGMSTGDPRTFSTFDDILNAFKVQVKHLVKHAFIHNRISDSIRPRMIASPLESLLHDLCMKNCIDIHQGAIKDGIAFGAWDPTGFGSVVDSLAALKKLVYDDKSVSMADLINAIENNFKDNEALRLLCLSAPKYGNNDPYADSIGADLEDFFRSISHSYFNLFGGKLDVRYVPVTSHVPFGAVVGATPDGRKAGEPLSEGVSPSQGCDNNGPTAVLLSAAKTKESKYSEIAARLLNIKFSPQSAKGDEGTRKLAAFIRTWCDLKHWHIQFNIINNETLRSAQKDPEKYRNLLVRVAGYSAYFVDLSPPLQEEIIKRTEHL